MAPKDILIVVDAANQQAAFAAAEALCKQGSPHVSCLQLVEIPDPRLSGAVFTTSVWAEMSEKARQRAARQRTAIAQRLSALEALSDIVTVEAPLDGLARAVAQRAMHADLTIMQRPEGPAAAAVFEAALFEFRPAGLAGAAGLERRTDRPACHGGLERKARIGPRPGGRCSVSGGGRAYQRDRGRCVSRL